MKQPSKPDLAPLLRGSRAEREEWARRNLGVRLGRAVGHEPQQRDDADLLDRAQASVRRILTQLAAEQTDVGALTAPLIVMPAAKRWAIVTTQPRLRVLPAVTALLDGAELLLDRGADEVEELVLAAMHLTERLSVARYSRAMMMDLYASAWLLRIEVALMRRQRDAAEFALSFVHHFQVEGTGDPHILFATARGSGWLDWFNGDLGSAAETFRVLARRTSQAQDPEQGAEAWQWCSLVHEQLGDTPAADKARARATGRLGDERARELEERLRLVAGRLGLGVAEGKV